jgi:aryl-alcohol dehydrogenase-like predicted oxidoreductase
MFSSGFLTGAYRSPSDFSSDDIRLWMPRFSEENFPKNLEVVDALSSIAKRKGCTTGQLTLAWLLAQGNDIIPIPGTKKIKYVEENVGALKVSLSLSEVVEIRTLVDNAGLAGDRYPEIYMKQIFCNTPEL